jgi:hypothetical protein
MAFFELLAGIGLVGTCISFATVMYLESGDSIEGQIANGSTILFLLITIAGVLGTLL